MHYSCELDDGGIVPLVLHDNLSGWVKLQEHAQPITWSTFGEGKGMLVSWSTSVGIGIVIFNMHTGTGEISLLGELEIDYPCTCKQSTPL